jgi:tellurite resistance protein TerC
VNGVKMATPLLRGDPADRHRGHRVRGRFDPGHLRHHHRPFIVLTSNVFAILGLRAMYFLLANMHERFHLLSYGLAIVLVFIGAKMLLIDVYKIPWCSRSALPR